MAETYPGDHNPFDPALAFTSVECAEAMQRVGWILEHAQVIRAPQRERISRSLLGRSDSRVHVEIAKRTEERCVLALRSNISIDT